MTGTLTTNTGVACNLQVVYSTRTITASNLTEVTLHAYLIHYSLHIGEKELTLKVVGATNGNADSGATQKITIPAISQSANTKTTRDLGSFTFTVPHNSDGTKSTTITGAIYNFNCSYGGKYLSQLEVTQALTLENIPRKSTIATYTSSVVVNGSNSISVGVTKLYSGYQHIFRFSIGSVSEASAKTSASSYSFTVPEAWNQYISKSATIVIALETYSGTTLIGTDIKYCTATAPTTSDYNPSGSVTVERVDNSVPSNWGIYVQGLSNLKLTSNATAGKYSSIKSIVFTVGSTTNTLTANGSVTFSLPTSGNISYSVVVTDNRDRKATIASGSITVEANVTPSVSANRTFRCDSEGNADEFGTHIKCSFSPVFSSCSGKNSATVTLAYKKTTDSAYGSATTVTNGSVISAEFDTSLSYDIRYVIIDSLNQTSTKYDFISTSRYIMHFKTDCLSIAFGTTATRDEGLEVALPTYFTKPVSFDDTITANTLSVETLSADIINANKVTIDSTLSVAGTVALEGDITALSVMEFRRYNASSLSFPVVLRNTANSSSSDWGVGVKFINNTDGDTYKWSAIAGLASSSYSYDTGLVFYTSGNARYRMYPGRFIPVVSGGSDLGGTSNKWARGYIVELYSNYGYFTLDVSVNGKLSVNGATTLSGLLTSSNNVVLSNNRSYYINDSGGTSRRAIYLNTANYYYIAGDAFSNQVHIGTYNYTSRVQLKSNTRIDFLINVSDTNSTAISLVWENNRPTLRPTINSLNSAMLGNSNYKWLQLYVQEPVVVGSDRRLKENIKDVPDEYAEMFDYLVPRTYILKNRINGRTTLGYIAQEVEEAAEKAGLSLKDCGFIIKDWVTRTDYVGWEYSLEYDGLSILTAVKTKKQDIEINNIKEKLQKVTDELAIAQALIAHLQQQAEA